jgi:hypothetical protein
MSDKETKGSKASTDKLGAKEAPKPTTLSIAPAMDLSLDAVTVPPPPTSGVASSGPFSIPRAPRVPTENAPAKRKRGEDDIFSIFDVEANTAADDIPVSVQFEKKPEPAPEKPKSKLGTGMEEREVTRSRQIPIDQDLFNLSGLFSSSDQSPLGAPNMSALSGSGSSENATSKPRSTSALDDLVLPPAPIAPVNSLDLLTASTLPPEPKKPSNPATHKAMLFAGIAAALLLIGGVFYLVQKSSTATEPTASVDPPKTSNEALLDTRPGQTTATDEPQARTGRTGTTPDQPASPDKPAPTAANGPAPKEASDKPTQTGTSDKSVAQGKPPEPEATDKPAEPAAPTGPSKAQSLAEAMAAAAPGGGGAPPPPPTSGPEFNKGAAAAALNGAAGSASGCKAPGDPSGVARVSVTFAPSGRATRAVVNGAPYSGTATGSCVAGAFRNLSVPPFTGDPVTVSKSVSIR